MLDTFKQMVQETIKSGIGQSIIAFGAWAYSLILLIAFLYYAFQSFLKLLLRRKK